MPEVVTDKKGKQRRAYRWYATPWEILRQLPNLARHLRPHLSVDELKRRAAAQTDMQAAAAMQEVKKKVFEQILRKRIA